MKCAVGCLKKLSLSNKPWLITGKGPTFDNIRKLTLSRFNTIALNHSCTRYLPDIAHFIDYDAWTDCADVLLDPADTVLVFMPWHPHVNFWPSTDTLDDMLRRDSKLQKIADQGRLYSYNSTTWPGKHNTELAKIRVQDFSASAAFGLLAATGVKLINTLGIDGGTAYSSSFASLNTRLVNGQESFDVQMPYLLELTKRHGITWCKEPEDVLPQN